MNSNDLVGNTEIINKFRAWLKDWFEVCIEGKTKEIPKAKGNAKW